MEICQDRGYGHVGLRVMSGSAEAGSGECDLLPDEKKKQGHSRGMPQDHEPQEGSSRPQGHHP